MTQVDECCTPHLGKFPLHGSPCVHHEVALVVKKLQLPHIHFLHSVISLTFLFLSVYSKKRQDLKTIYSTASYTETERDLFACKGMMPQSEHHQAWGGERAGLSTFIFMPGSNQRAISSAPWLPHSFTSIISPRKASKQSGTILPSAKVD